MKNQLEKKLAALPKTPGVYSFKDSSGETIYIGKAASLRNRVRSYFQKARVRNPKTDVMVSEIVSLDFTEVDTEADALFLEAELVRRYQPRFNILLRDDKSLLYVRVDLKSDYPTVRTVRRPLDDGAEYFGPFINSFALKKALRYLRRAFPYATSRSQGAKRVNLHYHLGLDPGLEEGRTSLEQYRANLKKLIAYLKGNRVSLMRDIERDMKHAAKAHEFEKAVALRNQLTALQSLSRQVLFSDRELADASRDEGLIQLAALLGLPKPPRRIEGFDISHKQGSDTVASMVVFNSGLPDKTAYRKFKMLRPGNDDFAHMAETVSRRLRETNVKKWGLPDLFLIDGGKGQLSAAMAARDETGHQNIPMIGLAKRFEEIIIRDSSDNFQVFVLGLNSPAIKLLQRIRDESHRFAVSYHSLLARRRQTASLLDGVPGIGPATRKKLIKSFGSTRGVMAASEIELAAVLGTKKAKNLHAQLSAIR